MDSIDSKCHREHQPNEDDLTRARERLGDAATFAGVYEVAVTYVDARCAEEPCGTLDGQRGGAEAVIEP